MDFLDDKYLLSSEVALAIYHTVRRLPILDAHNHADVQEIADNENYPNVWQLFAATDHYVWSLLRKRGVPEKFITGDATPKEKWMKMAEVFPQFAGNPVYEWIHLDLKRHLETDDVLGPATGEKIWEEANQVLAKPNKRPLILLNEMKVESMCSTDDPVDLLKEHDDVNEKAKRKLIRPSWRPDKAMNIYLPSWKDYINKLEERFNMKIDSIKDVVAALKASHDYFAEHGCVASDHGIVVPYAANADEKDADAVFKKAKSGKELTCAECETYMSYIFGEVAEMDAEKNWVFQMHIGAVRDVRDCLFENLGPDCGGDVSDHNLDILTPLKIFLNRFEDRLKVALYCLDAGHQATLATMARAFGAKVNLGSAWWLNDHPIGMRRQLEFIGSIDLLSNFVGMVSDSRKLLSYGSRHEMFRRVLSDVIGSMVQMGQIPYAVAEKLAQRMCYDGPKEFFGL